MEIESREEQLLARTFARSLPHFVDLHHLSVFSLALQGSRCLSLPPSLPSRVLLLSRALFLSPSLSLSHSLSLSLSLPPSLSRSLPLPPCLSPSLSLALCLLFTLTQMLSPSARSRRLEEGESLERDMVGASLMPVNTGHRDAADAAGTISEKTVSSDFM